MFFLVLISSSQIIFIPAAFPLVGPLQRAIILSICIIPYFFIYKTVVSKASIITNENHARNMRCYPYDNVLYKSGVLCRTCGFSKPARSKHCSICNVCVAKHDHHCIWVMNCIGRGNYAYFVAMLLSVSCMLSYGAYLALAILTGLLQNSSLGRFDGGTRKKSWSTGTTWTVYFSAWSWAMGEEIRIGAIGLLALLTAPLGWGLFFYHLYLIWAGMTTNESSKWAEWKDDIMDGMVYKRKGEAVVGMKERQEGQEPFVEWPAISKQIVVRSGNPDIDGCGGNGQASDRSPNNAESVQRTSAWTRVRRLHEIENLYDLGFWDNLGDVLSFE